jgi:hypothetical protein
LAEKIDVKTSSDVCRRGYLIHNVYLRFSLKVPKRRLLIVQFRITSGSRQERDAGNSTKSGGNNGLAMCQGLHSKISTCCKVFQNNSRQAKA